MLQTFGIDREKAETHLLFVKGVAGNMLSVLFNVFGSVPSESRGMVGEVIGSWMAVAEPKVSPCRCKTKSRLLRIFIPQEVENTFVTIMSHIKKPSSTQSRNSPTPVVPTMLDLLLVIIPYLPFQCATDLFSCVLGPEPNYLESADQAIQKKAYRIISRLIETGKLEKQLLADGATETVLNQLENCTERTLSGSKRVRSLSLPTLWLFLPSLINRIVSAYYLR